MNRENPFYFRELPLDAPFCNRVDDLEKLVSYAKADASVVIYSPRRFGKTSLIKRVQSSLSEQGYVTVFCDFFGVASVDDVAERIARSVYTVTHRHDSLFEKAVKWIRSFRPTLRPQEDGTVTISVEPASRDLNGLALLTETMDALKKFQSSLGVPLNIAMDEFQEITELKDSSQIEGVLRQFIQQIPCSFFFVGSRRRVLLTMFNERKRPFYQSSVLHELKPISPDHFIPFIQNLFEQRGRSCTKECLSEILSWSAGHPYYTQKACFFIYECGEERLAVAQVRQALGVLIENERPVFEAVIQGLAPKQISLLKALAEQPTASPFALDYMVRYHLGSSGAIQGALQKLSNMDLIEKDKEKVWRLVDPVFSLWLRQ